MTNATEDSVYAVVLAAGRSSRFGSAKQLARLDGVPLARRATSLAASACESRTLLVAGHSWREVLRAVAPLSGFVIINESPDDGVGASLSQAVRALRHVASAVVVILADQPLISHEHLRAMSELWSGDAREIIATSHSGVRGAPALLPAGCFDDLEKLTGDRGARDIIDDPRFSVRNIDFAAAATDIDTVDDLLRLARNARN